MTEDDGLVRLDAQHGSPGRITLGRNKARGHREKRSVRSDKFVLPRQANNFVDGGLVFAFALDFFQQGIHPCAGPQSRQLRMVRRLRAAELAFAEISMAMPSRIP